MLNRESRIHIVPLSGSGKGDTKLLTLKQAVKCSVTALILVLSDMLTHTAREVCSTSRSIKWRIMYSIRIIFNMLTDAYCQGKQLLGIGHSDKSPPPPIMCCTIPAP